MSLSKINVNSTEIVRVDEYPTQNSKNLLESGGMYDLNLENIRVNNIVLGKSIKNDFIKEQYLSYGTDAVIPFRDDSVAATNFLFIEDDYYVNILNYGYDLSPIGFFDSNKEYISMFPENSPSQIVAIENIRIKSIAPLNAKYVVFSTFCSSEEVDDYDVKILPIKETINEEKIQSSNIVIDTLRINTVPENTISSYTTEVYVANTKFCINSSNGELTPILNDSIGQWKVSNFIDVSSAISISITASSMGGFAFYAFYDKEQNFLESAESEHNFILQHLTNYLINIPINAYYVRLGCSTADDRYPGEEQPLFNLNIMNSKIISSSKIWSDKKWGLIGDSLTERNFRTTINYADYINQSTGINLINKAVSGAGYKRGHNFITQISELQLDVDVITAFGSVNDSAAGIPIGDVSDRDIETLCSYINSFISAVRTKFPTTPFGIISPSPCMGLTPLDSDTWMSEYSSKMKEICSLNSVPFLDLYHCSNLYPNDATFRQLAFSKDDGNGTHPDETGHKIIAPRFKNFLETLLY